MLAYPPLVLLVGDRLLRGDTTPRRAGVLLGCLTVAEAFIGIEVVVVTATLALACVLGVALVRRDLLVSLVAPPARGGRGRRGDLRGRARLPPLRLRRGPPARGRPVLAVPRRAPRARLGVAAGRVRGPLARGPLGGLPRTERPGDRLRRARHPRRGRPRLRRRRPAHALFDRRHRRGRLPALRGEPPRSRVAPPDRRRRRRRALRDRHDAVPGAPPRDGGRGLLATRATRHAGGARAVRHLGERAAGRRLRRGRDRAGRRHLRRPFHGGDGHGPRVVHDGGDPRARRDPGARRALRVVHERRGDGLAGRVGAAVRARRGVRVHPGRRRAPRRVPLAAPRRAAAAAAQRAGACCRPDSETVWATSSCGGPRSRWWSSTATCDRASSTRCATSSGRPVREATAPRRGCSRPGAVRVGGPGVDARPS